MYLKGIDANSICLYSQLIRKIFGIFFGGGLAKNHQRHKKTTFPSFAHFIHVSWRPITRNLLGQCTSVLKVYATKNAVVDAQEFRLPKTSCCQKINASQKCLRNTLFEEDSGILSLFTKLLWLGWTTESIQSIKQQELIHMVFCRKQWPSSAAYW